MFGFSAPSPEPSAEDPGGWFGQVCRWRSSCRDLPEMTTDRGRWQVREIANLAASRVGQGKKPGALVAPAGARGRREFCWSRSRPKARSAISARRRADPSSAGTAARPGLEGAACGDGRRRQFADRGAVGRQREPSTRAGSLRESEWSGVAPSRREQRMSRLLYCARRGRRRVDMKAGPPSTGHVSHSWNSSRTALVAGKNRHNPAKHNWQYARTCSRPTIEPTKLRSGWSFDGSSRWPSRSSGPSVRAVTKMAATRREWWQDEARPEASARR